MVLSKNDSVLFGRNKRFPNIVRHVNSWGCLTLARYVWPRVIMNISQIPIGSIARSTFTDWMILIYYKDFKKTDNSFAAVS